MPRTRKTRSRSGSKKRGGGWFSSSKKNYNIGKPKAPRIPWHITGENQANTLKKAMKKYKNEMVNWSSKTKKAANGSYEREIDELKRDKAALLKEVNEMEKDVKECEREVAKLRGQKNVKRNRFGLSNNTSKLRIRIPKNNNWNNSLSGSSGYTPRSVSSLNRNRKYKKD
jgi:hypothetical protein